MPAIEVKHLTKRFVQKNKQGKKQVDAVRGITLQVRQGEVFGFLGPNGAGKTTTMRMLTTLLPMDEGTASVAGFDLRKQPQEVRQHIGYVSQLGGADLSASGWENLVLQGQLYRLTKKEAVTQAEEFIDVFDLKHLIDRKVQTYSGGQKRRLEIAMGMMHDPQVIFLDEPTAGLDLQNRANLWEQIRKLKVRGTTVFLTTHYLEEADALADRIVIMDHGKIVADGSPDELKQQISGDDVVTITVNQKQQTDIDEKNGEGHPFVLKQLEELSFVNQVHNEGNRIRLYMENGATYLPAVYEWFGSHNIDIVHVSVSQPSLDDVFLKETGRSLRDTGAEGGNHT